MTTLRAIIHVARLRAPSTHTLTQSTNCMQTKLLSLTEGAHLSFRPSREVAIVGVGCEIQPVRVRLLKPFYDLLQPVLLRVTCGRHAVCQPKETRQLQTVFWFRSLGKQATRGRGRACPCSSVRLVVGWLVVSIFRAFPSQVPRKASPVVGQRTICQEVFYEAELGTTIAGNQVTASQSPHEPLQALSCYIWCALCPMAYVVHAIADGNARRCMRGPTERRYARYQSGTCCFPRQGTQSGCQHRC